jgi:hypothetical protein
MLFLLISIQVWAVSLVGTVKDGLVYFGDDARPIPASLRSWGLRTCRCRVVAEMAVSTLPSSLMTLVVVVALVIY